MKIANHFAILASLIPWLFIFGIRADDCCDLDMENTLHYILTPQENPSLQLQALRRSILERVLEGLEAGELLADNKRSVSSLAQLGELPGKRNLAALARSGLLSSSSDEGSPAGIESDNNGDKLSLQDGLNSDGGAIGDGNEQQNKNDKRAVWLHPHVRKVLRDAWSRKRTLASLARARQSGKRNIGSLNKYGGYPPIGGGGTRLRRNSDYDDYELTYPELNEMQNDYGGLMDVAEKRFLGRLPQMGKSRTTPAPKALYQ